MTVCGLVLLSGMVKLPLLHKEAELETGESLVNEESREVELMS